MNYKEIIEHNQEIKETLIGLFGPIGESYYKEIVGGYRNFIKITDDEPIQKQTLFELFYSECTEFNQKILFLNVLETNYQDLRYINQFFFENYLKLNYDYKGFFNGYITLIIKRLLTKFSLQTFFRALDLLIVKLNKNFKFAYNIKHEEYFKKEMEKLEDLLILCANDDKKYQNYVMQNSFKAVKKNEQFGRITQ